MISVENLTKTYGTSVVLDINHLEFESGNLHLLTGPNGAGKTTLLKLLGGVLLPDQGTIHCAHSTSQRILCFQNPFMFSGSVLSNIHLGFKLRKREPAMDIIDYYVRKLDIKHLITSRASQLSAGEKQRVSLARAMVLEPMLLLLDEPGANLDCTTMETVEALLRDMLRQGITIIMSSHDQEQVNRLAGRVIRLNKGRLAE